MPRTFSHRSVSTAFLRALPPLMILVGLSCGLAMAGNPFWESKICNRWSANQCRILLHETVSGSPWAAAVGDTVREGNGYELETETTVQFRSAAPIRLALARQEQLKAKYDKMSAAEKTEFDQKLQPEIDPVQGDRVLLHIRTTQYGLGKNSPAIGDRAVDSVILILSDGRQMNALSVRQIKVSDGYEYEALFPRAINGEAIIKITDKKVRVSCGGCDGPIEFNPSKMVFHGKLEY